MSALGAIFVPLDGSDLAERAVPVAAELARKSGAALRLVHVHVPMPTEPIYVEGLPVVDEHLRPLRKSHEQAYLDRAVERLAAGTTAQGVILEGGAASALAAHARREGAALVVMTTHGRGGLERAWLGSVAEEVIRLSPAPVLLVRPAPSAVSGTFRRILVPLDGSAMGEAVLEHAARLARLDPEAELVLLQVLQPLSSAVWVPDAAVLAAWPAGEVAHRDEEAARLYLRGVADRLDKQGLRARAGVRVSGTVAPAILEAAKEEKVDLVALSTHGRSGFARFALGSVADKVLRACPVPVLVYRPPEKTQG
jgi:nucleotide-binding universal stress UspA family protein